MNLQFPAQFFSSACRQRRLELQISATELAVIADVPVKTVVLVEWRAMGEVDVLSLHAICDALELDVVDLCREACVPHLAR